MEDSSVAPFLQETHDETPVAISPDRRYLAYQSTEGGYPEIVVRPYPELNGLWMVSTGDYGGKAGLSDSNPAEVRFPVWSRDGSWLYYLGGRTLARVPVNTSGTFTFGSAEPFVEGSWNGDYDAHPDGRLLMIVQGQAAVARNELVVVRNWAALLEEAGAN